MKTKLNVKKYAGIGKTLLLPIIMFALMEILSWSVSGESLFGTVTDVNNFFRNIAVSTIAAYALSLNMSTGRMDLSLGAQQLIGCLIGGNIALSLGLGSWGVLFFSVLFGTISGFIVGVLFVTLRLEAFVLGLGVALIYETFATAFAVNGLQLFGKGLSLLSNTWFFVIVGVIVSVAMILLIHHSKFGLQYGAIQGSQRIAINSGINITKSALICYAICGGLIALSGCLSTGKTGYLDATLNLSSTTTAFIGFVPVFLALFLQRWCPLMVGIPLSVITFQFLSMGLSSLNLSSAASTTITMAMLLVFLVGVGYLNELRTKKRMKERMLAV